jgi:hypothetical protein
MSPPKSSGVFRGAPQPAVDKWCRSGGEGVERDKEIYKNCGNGIEDFEKIAARRSAQYTNMATGIAIL